MFLTRAKLAFIAPNSNSTDSTKLQYSIFIHPLCKWSQWRMQRRVWLIIHWNLFLQFNNEYTAATERKSRHEREREQIFQTVKIEYFLTAWTWGIPPGCGKNWVLRPRIIKNQFYHRLLFYSISLFLFFLLCTKRWITFTCTYYLTPHPIPFSSNDNSFSFLFFHIKQVAKTSI